MTSWATGLLAVGAGMGEGMARSSREGAQRRREEILEEKRQEAAALKQENHIRLQHDLLEHSKANDRAYQDKVRADERAYKGGLLGSGQYLDGKELSKSDLSRLNDEDRGRTISTQAYKEGQAAQEDSRAKGLLDYEQGLKQQAPTDLEQKYSFLANTFGEEKAKAMIEASLVKGKGGQLTLDQRKLWGKTYTDTLKSLELNQDMTPEGKDRYARKMADEVAGMSLGGSGGGGSLLDKYLAGATGKVGDRTGSGSGLPQTHGKVSPELKGLLSGADVQQNPIDPRTWDVKFMGPGEEKPYVMEASKIRYLSDAEYAAYKKATSTSGALKNIFHSMGAKTEI